MAASAQAQLAPELAQAQQMGVAGTPEVATETHPAPLTGSAVGEGALPGGEAQLQKLLPEITEVAHKVGGFKKLAEIATALDEMGK